MCAVGVSAISVVSCGDSSEPSMSSAQCSCEQRVLEELDVDSSTEFSQMQFDTVTDAQYSAEGGVDYHAENGAMMRTSFECTVEFRDGDAYARIDNLSTF
jgi:hypothetical protein